MKGWIFIEVNSLMEDVLRIGSSSNDPGGGSKKASQKNSLPGQTSTPYSCWVSNYKSVEQKVHEALEKFSIEGSPNWYRLTVSKAIKGIREVGDPIFEDSQVSSIPTLVQKRINELQKRVDYLEDQVEDLISEERAEERRWHNEMAKQKRQILDANRKK